VSRLAKLTDAQRADASQLKLTKLTFAALRYHGLTPVTAQRVVLDEVLNVGTAIDIICLRGSELCVTELKTGYAGDRAVAARVGGAAQMMQRPFHRASDCVLHRHFAQLAATLALFESEIETINTLKEIGVTNVRGILLYVNDAETELHELPDWWARRGDKLLSVLC